MSLEPLILSLEVTLKVVSKATCGFGRHYLILEASFTLIASLGPNVMLKLAPESITCGFKASKWLWKPVTKWFLKKTQIKAQFRLLKNNNNNMSQMTKYSILPRLYKYFDLQCFRATLIQFFLLHGATFNFS